MRGGSRKKGSAWNKKTRRDPGDLEPLTNTDDALSFVPEEWFVCEMHEFDGGWECLLLKGEGERSARAWNKSLPIAILLAVLQIEAE